MGKSKAKIQPNKRGYLLWHWKNKHRTLKIPRWLAMRYRQNIGTEWDTAAVNGDLGPMEHKALDEIRAALIAEGFIKVRQMLNPEHIPATGDNEWGEEDTDHCKRWRKWNSMVKDDLRARESVILFAKGERLGAIERTLKIRKGTARMHITNGIALYAAIMRGEKKLDRGGRYRV